MSTLRRRGAATQRVRSPDYAPGVRDSVVDLVHSEAESLTYSASQRSRRQFYAEFGNSGYQDSQERSRLIRKLARKSTEAGMDVMADRVRWLGFGGVFGSGKAAFLPRLLALWVIGLPILLFRLCMLVAIFWVATGGITTTIYAGATGGSFAFQYYYREVLVFVKDDDTFQGYWDMQAFLLSLILNILLYFVRLTQEIWNGFCPLLALFVDLLYEICRQLVVIWYSTPVLQYAFFWLVRLIIFLTEPALDALVSILEAFADFAQDMTVGLTEAMVEEIQNEANGGASRRPLGAEEVHVAVGEVLLHIAVVIGTLLIRIAEALFVAFLPLIYSFFRLVLPKIIKYIPPLLDIALKVGSIFTSEPVLRVLDFLLQAAPVVLELIQAITCAVVTYLGAVACYALYIMCVMLSFYLKYVIRPCLCGGAAILGGCFKAFVNSALDGEECFSCGGYHTSCGCKRGISPTAGCGSKCNDGSDGTDVKANPTPRRTNRTAYDSVDPQETHTTEFTSDPASVNDKYVPRNYVTDDPDPDIVRGKLDTSIAKSGQGWEECNHAATNYPEGEQDSSYCGGSDAVSTTYGVTAGNLRRRRTSTTTTASTAPPLDPQATIPPVPPQGDPNLAGANAKVEVTSTTTSSGTRVVAFSQGATATASAGFYASHSLEFTGTEGAYLRWGSLPVQTSTDTLDAGFYRCNSFLQHGSSTDYVRTACDAHRVSSALSDSVFDSPLSALSISGTWRATEYTDQGQAWYIVHLARTQRVTSIELRWTTNSNGLVYGPGELTAQFQGQSATVQKVSTGPCTSVGGFRVDRPALGSPHSTDRVRIQFNRQALCHYKPEHSSLVRRGQHASPAELVSFFVYGFSTVGKPGDTVNWFHNASVYASTTVRAASASVKTWDPCARGSLIALHDGLDSWPSAVIAVDPADAAPQLQLDIVPTRISSNGALITPAVNVERMVLRLGAMATVDLDTLALCPIGKPPSHPDCVQPDTTESTTTDLEYSPTVLADLKERFGSSASTAAPFYETDYPVQQLPSRGASVTFVNVSHFAGSGSTLHFVGSWASKLPVTDWITAQLELGLSPAHYTEAQFVSDLAEGLAADGVVSTRVPSDGRLCRHMDNAGTKSAAAAKYSDPFEGKHRRWLGVSQITLFGEYPSSSTVETQLHSRRLMTTEGALENEVTDLEDDEATARLDDNRTEAMERDLMERVRQSRLRANRMPDAQFSVESVMSSRGLNLFKLGESPSNTRESPVSEAIYEHQARGAEQSGKAQPFASNLQLMPDAGKEPMFKCSTFELDSADQPPNATEQMPQQAMKCWHLAPPALPAADIPAAPSESASADPKSGTGSDVDKRFDSEALRLFSAQPELQARLAAANGLMEQRAFLRQLRMSRALNTPLETKSAPAEPAANSTTSSSRKLLALTVSDILDIVKEPIDLALKMFEGYVTTVVLKCFAYCWAVPGCDDMFSLGDCTLGVIYWIIQQLFSCDSDDSIYECTIGKLIDWVLKLLRQLLDWLLELVDLMGEGVASILGLGDLLKLIGCQACSIATLLTGLLSDFASKFPLSMCLMIVSVGTDQCEKWGLGDASAIGSQVFGNILPLLKIMFGIIQVAPALLEVLFSVGSVVLSNALEIFPDLLEDGFDVIMWFISSSDVIGTLETLFESLDPILTEANERASKATGSRGGSFDDITTDAGWKTDPTAGDGVTFHPPQGTNACLQETGNPNSNAQCDTRQVGTTDPASGMFGTEDSTAKLRAESATAQQTALNDQTAAQTPPSSGGSTISVTFPLRNCGCTATPHACEEGPGSAGCKYSASPRAEKTQERAQKARTAASTDQTNRDLWEHCEEINERVVLPTSNAGGSARTRELKKQFIVSKKCYIMVRQGRSETHVNYGAIETELTKADPRKNMANPPWWPFLRFSKQSGEPTLETDADFKLGEFDGSFKPTLGDIHRRRRTDDASASSTSSRRLAGSVHAHRRLFGVSDLYPDTRAIPETEFVDQEIVPANSSYAEEQLMALAKDLWILDTTLKQVLVNVTEALPDLVQWDGAMKKARGAARQILGIGFSDVEMEDIGCGFTKVAGTSPNTYPCCKGLWCCVRPLIPRDFRFQRDWFAWHDEYEINTRCHELNTHSDGYVFAVRATLLAMRTAAKTVVRLWPLTAMIDTVWGFTTFENDTWPQRKYHPAGFAEAMQVVCVGMNAGIYITFLMGMLLVYIGWTAVADFLAAHLLIVMDTFYAFDLQSIEIRRRESERDAAVARARREQKQGRADNEVRTADGPVV